MAGKPWFRVYTRLRGDARVSALSDQEFKAFILLLCMAAENDRGGYAEMAEGEPWEDDDLAAVLRLSSEEFEKVTDGQRATLNAVSTGQS